MQMRLLYYSTDFMLVDLITLSWVRVGKKAIVLATEIANINHILWSTYERARIIENIFIKTGIYKYIKHEWENGLELHPIMS